MFEDAQAYEDRIRLLVPGYALLHALCPPILRSALGEGPARILVVGSGPGTEIIALAQSNPQWTFVAIDPSPAMVEEGRQNALNAGLGPRVSFQVGSLESADLPRGSFDAWVCLLVSHFLPDDGQRGRFLNCLGSLLKAGAPGLIADFEDGAPVDSLLRRAHGLHALSLGLPPERLELMEERMTQGTFHPISAERFDGLAARAGFAKSTVVFQALNLVCRLLIKAP